MPKPVSAILTKVIPGTLNSRAWGELTYRRGPEPSEHRKSGKKQQNRKNPADFGTCVIHYSPSVYDSDTQTA
jgi:hypothetical protein